MFTAKTVFTFILGCINPCLNTNSMLEIIFPEALVLCTIYMTINTKSIGFIISPLPFITISIYMIEFSLSVCFIIFPLTFVFCPIGPYLKAFSMFDPHGFTSVLNFFHLARIRSSVSDLKFYFTLKFTFIYRFWKVLASPVRP